MIYLSSIRRGVLLSSACAALVACSGGGNVQNSGSIGPVSVGNGSTSGGSNALSFVPAGFACPNGTNLGTFQSGATTIEGCIISGDVVADLTLPGSVQAGGEIAYILNGSVFVGENTITRPAGATATLTIGAGAYIIGQSGEDALIVNPGSRIEAVGTSSAPIVMTSASDAADGNVHDGLVNGSPSEKGQWGGLVLNGLARINDCNDATATPGTADCIKTGEGGSGVFGGDNDFDDSGTLQYVRVQYAGFRFNGSDELNGIAFQGVGSGTTVDHIHVHNGNDDGVEFFGGTVDANYVVITGADDDSIDWTDGWRGDLQFGLVIQDDISADRGIEGDNRGNDINVGDVQGLRSNPQISNITFLGSSAAAASPSDGIKLRAGTSANIANAIIVGFGLGDGLDYDDTVDYNDDDVDDETSTATPSVNSLFVAENAAAFDGDGGVLFAAGASNTNAAFSTLDGVRPGAAEQAVAATDITSASSDLVFVNYIGAFDPSSTSLWTDGWTLGGIIPGATPPQCPAGTAQSADSVSAGRVEQLICIVPNSIETDLTLTAGNLYKFSGTVFVGDDLGPDAANPLAGSSAQLFIEPGVVIYGENGEDAIVVNRGSRLVAQGTASAPIVFTSESDLRGTLTGTEKGEFGGLVINGRAGINDCNVGINMPGSAGCEKTGEGGSGLFGGNDDNDDSGVLSYVQVRYAGFRFNGSDELNGVAFQGVGDGTVVDHLQVHNGNDDGVEFFGGTVDVKYLVITGADDDSIDWTDGWRGSVQYALVIQDDVSADRGIEGDNRGNDINVGDSQGMRSLPTISNFTFFGSSAAAASPSDGVKIRAGSDAILMNGIVSGFGLGDGLDYDAAVDYNDDDTDDETSTATPEVFSLYVAENANAFDSDGGVLFNATGSGNVAATDRNLNGFIPNATLVGAIGPFDVTGYTFPAEADNSGVIEQTDYVGAFDPVNETNADNWALGWTFNVSTSLSNVN